MKTVIHFGAGALGRGLTIPMLVKSECEVIVVDAYDLLVDELKKNLKYRLFSVDAETGFQHQEIKINRALSLNSDIEEVKKLLKRVDTVTTSVIRENVIHVAKLIAECWNTKDADEKTIYLCENIENAHDFFRGLLRECSSSEDQLSNLMKIKVPNTMVDRGCMKNPNDILEVITDEFLEICTDKRVVNNTGIKFIPAVEKIDSIFARKRYLVNTYVDSIAFLGSRYGSLDFESALYDERIVVYLEPYMKLVKKALNLGFGLSTEEIERWDETYRTRISSRYKLSAKLNESVKSRPLDNIARNMLRKLNYDERFVSPLIILRKLGEDISDGLPIICDIVETERAKQNLTKDGILSVLRNMWCIDEYGEYVYDKVKEKLGYE